MNELLKHLLNETLKIPFGLRLPKKLICFGMCMWQTLMFSLTFDNSQIINISEVEQVLSIGGLDL